MSFPYVFTKSSFSTSERLADDYLMVVEERRARRRENGVWFGCVRFGVSEGGSAKRCGPWHRGARPPAADVLLAARLDRAA